LLLGVGNGFRQRHAALEMPLACCSTAIERAAAVQREGAPELVDAVDRGEMAVIATLDLNIVGRCSRTGKDICPRRWLLLSAPFSPPTSLMARTNPNRDRTGQIGRCHRFGRRGRRNDGRFRQARGRLRSGNATLIGLSSKRREQSQIAPAIALTVLALLGFAAAVAYLA
jgi:hypothetical protein